GSGGYLLDKNIVDTRDDFLKLMDVHQRYQIGQYIIDGFALGYPEGNRGVVSCLFLVCNIKQASYAGELFLLMEVFHTVGVGTISIPDFPYLAIQNFFRLVNEYDAIA